jgi:hypothetical protein
VNTKLRVIISTIDSSLRAFVIELVRPKIKTMAKSLSQKSASPKPPKTGAGVLKKLTTLFIVISY